MPITEARKRNDTATRNVVWLMTCAFLPLGCAYQVASADNNLNADHTAKKSQKNRHHRRLDYDKDGTVTPSEKKRGVEERKQIRERLVRDAMGIEPPSLEPLEEVPVRATRHIRSEADFHRKKARDLIHQNRNEDAIKEYSILIEEQPSPAVFSQRGWAYWRIGKYQKALDDFNKAITSAKTDGNRASHRSYLGRALTYFRCGEYDKVVPDCTAVLAVHNSPYAHFYRGQAYLRLGEFEKAFADEESAIRQNRSIAEVYQKIRYRQSLEDDNTTPHERTSGGDSSSEEGAATPSQGSTAESFAADGVSRAGFLQETKSSTENLPGTSDSAVARSNSSRDVGTKPEHGRSTAGKAAQNAHHPEGEQTSKVASQLPQDSAAPIAKVGNKSTEKATGSKLQNCSGNPGMQVRVKEVEQPAAFKNVAIPVRTNGKRTLQPRFDSVNPTSDKSAHLAKTFLAPARSGQIVAPVERLRQHQLEAINEFSKLIMRSPEDADSYYNRGLSELMVGRFADSATDFRQYIRIVNWNGTATIYAAVLCSLGYTAARQQREAESVLKEAAAKVDHKRWPYPIIEFLRKECSEEQVLAMSPDKYSQTTARAYIGMSYIFGGQKIKGRELLYWVKQNGDSRMEDYTLGVMSLNHP